MKQFIKLLFNLNTGYFINTYNYYHNGILEEGYVICKGYILFGISGYDKVEFHYDLYLAKERLKRLTQ